MTCFWDDALWSDAWAVLLGLAGTLWVLGFLTAWYFRFTRR